MKYLYLFVLVPASVPSSGCTARGEVGAAWDNFRHCGSYETGSNDHLYCLETVRDR